jgi:concanavalin A-like lectin/glucanase superfamily protein
LAVDGEFDGMSRFSPGLIGGGLDQFTKILLHMDGANAGTSFPDAAKPSRAWTAGGTGVTSTVAQKFGSASLNCGAVTGWIDTPDDADFTLGAGDFTADCWFNVQGGAGTSRQLFGQVDSGNFVGNMSISAILLTTNSLRFNACQGTTLVSTFGVATITAAGWHHFAAVRSGGTLMQFLDGVLENSVAISGSVNDSAFKFAVGRLGEVVVSGWNGFIDEFRLSVGIARWTANFTPPAAPYS